MKTHKKICVLGIGNMGEAIINGMLSAGLYTKKDIIASDVSDERFSHISSRYGVTTTRNNSEAAASSEFIIVSVKPDMVRPVIEEISPSADKSKIIISIAAGIQIDKIRKWLKKDVPVVRVMPNIPVLVREGATAIAPGPGIKGKDLEEIRKIFDSVGRSVILDEGYLNAVTGLSGSGPAYIFTIIEALSDGGVKAGLPRGEATILAAQTVLGAAKMVLESGEHTGRLKDMVTSPGGTTIAGIYRIEESGVRAAMMKAVEEATKRAIELGRGE